MDIQEYTEIAKRVNTITHDSCFVDERWNDKWSSLRKKVSMKKNKARLS